MQRVYEPSSVIATGNADVEFTGGYPCNYPDSMKIREVKPPESHR